MLVRDVMVYGAVMIEPTASVADAALMMAQEDVGMLVVGKGDRAEGVITDRDLLVKCVGAGEMPDSRTVGEYMVSPVISVQPSEDVVVASHLMREKHIQRLPVVENGELKGVISHTDIAQTLGQITHDVLFGSGEIRRMPAAMQIGTVTHYYNHSGVAVVAINVPVRSGETLRFVGHTTNFRQQADSLQIDHKAVSSAFPGDDLAIKVESRVRSGDRIYRVAS